MKATKENIEDYENFLAEAPEGSTHYIVIQYDCVEAFIRIKNCVVYTLNIDGITWGDRSNFNLNGLHQIVDLDDIRQQVEFMKQVIKLEDELKQLRESKSQDIDEVVEGAHKLRELAENIPAWDCNCDQWLRAYADKMEGL